MRIQNLALLLAFFAASVSAQSGGDSITLERTECFGSCPAYLLRISASGSVSFQRGPSTNRQPELKSSIDPAEFVTLVAEFDRIKFLDFNSSYAETHSDGFQTFVRWNRNGQEKVVAHWDVAPPGLDELERKIARAANLHNWLHDNKARLSLESAISGSRMGGVEDLKNEMWVREDAYYRIKRGMTPLMEAAATDNFAEMRRLTEQPVDLNAVDETGWTALMFAAVALRTDCVSALLEAGARMDVRDSHGDTALIGASAVRFQDQRRAAEIVNLLLVRGASVSETNDLGESALMWAARAGNPHTIKVLLDHGADPKQADKTEHSAPYYLRSARQGLAFDPALVERYNQAEAVLQR